MLNPETVSMKTKELWRLIAKSLGEKASSCDKEADRVAFIRLLMFLSIFITNGFIIFNAVRTHIVPAETKPIKCVIETSSFTEYQTPPVRKLNKSFEFE